MLQTQRHDHAVCRAGGLAGEGHRPVLQTASAPGVFEVSATLGRGVSRRDAVAPGDGQLRDAQASEGASLAQTKSSFHSALCADELQLVESGGAVVWRANFQA